MIEVVATKNGIRETFSRATEAEAGALAAELEKEGRSVLLDKKLFLNSAGPEGLYLHQNSGSCPLCIEYKGCARCKSNSGAFYSVKPTHYHSTKVEGVPGHKGIHDLLCFKCHRKDRFEVYGEGYGEAVA